MPSPTNSTQPAPDRVSPLHVAALIGIPVFVAVASGWYGLLVVGQVVGFFIAIYANLGTRQILAMLVVGGLITIGLMVGVTLVVELIILGPVTRRPARVRSMVRWTRLAVPVLAVALPMGVFAWRDAMARQAAATAVARAWQERLADEHRRAEGRKRAEERDRLLTTGTPAQVLAGANELRCCRAEVERILVDASLDDGVRLNAIGALGSAGNPLALPLLRSIATSEASDRLDTVALNDRYREDAARAADRITGETKGLWAAYDREQRAAKAVQWVWAAEASSASSLGWFDTSVECLRDPHGCNEGASIQAVATIAYYGQRIQLPTPGYRTSLVGGPPVTLVGRSGERPSRTAVSGYVFLAWPDEPYRTGIRGFCADDSGVICGTLDGRRPAVAGTRCQVTGRALPDDIYPQSSITTRRRLECKAAE